jgi:hypothetical protein
MAEFTDDDVARLAEMLRVTVVRWMSPTSSPATCSNRA